MRRHRVCIRLAEKDGESRQVLKGRTIRFPSCLLRLLFGKFSQVLVLTPGESVEAVEIRETIQEDKKHEAV